MWIRFWESWCDCVTRRCALWWKTYQMHSLHSDQVKEIWPSARCRDSWSVYFFNPSRMNCQESLCTVKWRWSLDLNEEGEAVCHFVCCFSASPSIKAVAHLLIRADVPANHSDEEEEEEEEEKKREFKTALAKRQSEASWMNLKWCVKTGNSS